MTDQPRAEVVAEERSRRKPKTATEPALRRFGVPAEVLDLDKYVYRSVVDDGNKLHELTKNDDYEFVTFADGKVGKSLSLDNAGAIKYRSGTKLDGAPAYTYLLRKLKKFADEHRREAVQEIDAQERAQLRGETKDAPDQKYTPKR